MFKYNIKGVRTTILKCISKLLQYVIVTSKCKLSENKNSNEIRMKSKCANMDRFFCFCHDQIRSTFVENWKQ